MRATLVELDAETRLMLVAMHHIVTDGWSMDVFHRELRALSLAFATGEPSPLPALAVQYGDFAAWQREQSIGPALDAQLDWWRQALEGAPPVLELPTDRPRPAVQSDGGAFRTIRLSGAVSARLRELARRAGTTLFTVLLAAFAALLARLSGQTDLVIGLPVGGRSRGELEPLIGFFVNTVVLRIDVAGNPPFGELVQRVRQTTTDALAHQGLPFERLVAALTPDRHLSRAPLFQVMAQMLSSETLTGDDDAALADAEPGDIEEGTSLFDLSIDFIDTAHGIKSTIQYSTDLFEHETIARWLRAWCRMLETVAVEPARAVWQLPMMSAEERALVVRGSHGIAVRFPEMPSVSALIAAHGARQPHATAVIGADETLTYGQLCDRVAALAAELRACGVGPETMVVVCMDRTPAYVVAVLAVLEAGGAYVPIDPSTPADRIAYILNDTGTPIVLTQSWLAERLARHAGRTIYLDRESFPVPSPRPAPTPVTADTLAYVIYTSGSTGRPKGVQVPQGALLNFVRAAVLAYGLRPDDRVLQFASIAFDTSIEEIFGSLSVGATLVTRTPTMLESVDRFLTECGALAVTVLDPPTAFWHLLVQSLAAGDAVLPASVRLVIFGSERALPERLADWDRVVGSRVRLMHGYGPTETTVVATVADLTCPPGGRPVTREVPIGHPVANLHVYVVDEHGQPVPVGVQGEGLIGGAQLARGYLNQPEATAAVFVDDPFVPGQRVYRSGDRLSRLPDGQLMFHGRVDAQVKIRGYRVEPGEVLKPARTF